VLFDVTALARARGNSKSVDMHRSIGAGKALPARPICSPPICSLERFAGQFRRRRMRRRDRRLQSSRKKCRQTT
jgi:hypothetical protein